MTSRTSQDRFYILGQASSYFGQQGYSYSIPHTTQHIYDSGLSQDCPTRQISHYSLTVHSYSLTVHYSFTLLPYQFLIHPYSSAAHFLTYLLRTFTHQSCRLIHSSQSLTKHTRISYSSSHVLTNYYYVGYLDQSVSVQ